MLTLTDRADLGVFYDADAQRYGAQGYADTVTRERFAHFYADCPSIGFADAGQAIGGILFDGNEAHIAVLPSHHGRWALLLKPALQWLFTLRQDITVAVERDNARCLRFLDRHGWQRVGERDGDVLYRLVPQGGTRKTAYPFRRGARAPSTGTSPCTPPK